eukprot:Hpha_TRINITY_DN17368_c0_g1::TRINITY_DN17368_c0_g1_i1::g.137931::m.137931
MLEALFGLCAVALAPSALSSPPRREGRRVARRSVPAPPEGRQKGALPLQSERCVRLPCGCEGKCELRDDLWWSKSHELRVANCVKATKSRIVVELGTQWGNMASTLLRNCPDIVLHSVDMFQPDYDTVDQSSQTYMKDAAMRNLSYSEFSAALAHRSRCQFAGFNNNTCRYYLHHMSTVEAAKLFASESVDFLYVDALHTYEGVTADLAAWHPKVKPEGFVVFNDYMPKETLYFIRKTSPERIGKNRHPDVVNAADHYVAREGLAPLQFISGFDAYTRRSPTPPNFRWPCTEYHPRIPHLKQQRRRR